MSNGEFAFFALVLCAFATFIAVVGFVSIWSRRPSQSDDAMRQAGEPVLNVHGRPKMKWGHAESVGSSGATRPSQAA